MNKSIWAGLLIVAAIMAVSLFGRSLSPYDVTDKLKTEYIKPENEKGYFISPPMPPGSMYALGTDKYGYDLLAKLIEGAKVTIVLSLGIATARVAIGGIAGMLLGYSRSNPISRARAPSSWVLLNCIPVFVIVLLTFRGIATNTSLSPNYLTIAMALLMIGIGIPSVASAFMEKSRVLRDREFVHAARALGAGHWRVIRRHLFPNLKESYLIAILHEVVIVLAIFGQLGMFNLFVGGTDAIYELREYTSRTNEWAGLIGHARNHLHVDRWILFIPLALYLILMLAFHLVAGGLESRHSKRYANYSRL